MDATVALVVATAGTLGGAVGGAVVTLKGARSLSRDEREAIERRETARAYRAYVAEAVKSVAELRQLPPVPKPDPLTEAVGSVLGAFRSDADETMATKRRIYQQYGERHQRLADQLVTIGIDLVLREIPASARAAVKTTNDYILRLSEERSEELAAEWKEIHAQLMAAGTEVRDWGASHKAPHKLPTNDVEQRESEGQSEGRDPRKHWVSGA